MDALAAVEIFLFEGFRLDHRGGGLFRADDSGGLVPVAIGSRALDLLALLIKRPGDLVTKDTIMNAVWPGLTVADSNLPTQIWALRRVLDPGRTQGSCIRTVAGRGYRFVAEVTCAAAEVRPAGPWVSSGVATRQPVVAAPLTLVVLLFDNFSTRADQQSFADRITDDLTTDLSRFTSMRVTSRKTAFTYRNKPVDAKRIGRELGVRYLLEGSVHPSANHVRVNARLIDAETDTHLWAERFDRDPDSLFGVQDEITKRATVSLYQALIGADASRQAEYPDPLEYVLRGRAATLKPRNREGYAQAIGMYERALELDPQFAEAKGWLADNLACRVLDEMADAAAVDIARAEGLAEQAVAASPRTAFLHVAKGQVLLAQGRYNEATVEFEIASAILPPTTPTSSRAGVSGVPISGPRACPASAKRLVEYCDALEQLVQRLVRVYARALNLPATYFDAPFTDFQYKLRATHYPSQPKAADDEFGIAPHTDTSFLTLLAPNDVPGLAFRTQAGDWIDVPTVADAFIVNGGQLLLRWTNDCFLATPHRAVNRTGVERYALAFFCDAQIDWPIAAVPTCVGPGRPPRYETTYYTDYMIRYQARTYNVFGDQAKGAAE